MSISPNSKNRFLRHFASRYFASSFAVLSVLVPLTAQAAILYLSPEQTTRNARDIFIQEVKIDTEGQAINALDIELSFPKDILEVQGLSAGNSILTLWPQEPVFSNENGVISFAGGVPGGYNGSGDSLLKVIFRARDFEGLSRKAELNFSDNCKALLNDGLGTSAQVKTKNIALWIAPPAQTPANEWQREIEGDLTAPESFEVELLRDANLFEGKYFAVFSTVDKQTGVAYYEIKEGDKRKWKKAVSPYVLEDQSRKGTIFVKAVDKAGNQRIVYYPGKRPWFAIVLAVVIFATALVLFVWLWRRRKNRK